MRTLLATLLALLVLVPAAQADDAKEIKVALADVGASHVRVISCTPDRSCVARYRYVDHSLIRAGFRRLAIRRCQTLFTVSNGSQDVGDGLEWDYVEVSWGNEHCWSPAAHATRGLQP